MTRGKFLSSVASSVALLLVTTACAAGRAGPELSAGDVGGAIEIRVENDFSPPGPVTIWILTVRGGRRNLGSVPADRNRRFRFADYGLPREYVLMAVLEDRREILSRRFQLFDGAIVRWWIRNNDVRVTPGN